MQLGLDLSNVGPFAKPTHLDIELQPGVVVLGAENGSGKSYVTQVIARALSKSAPAELSPTRGGAAHGTAVLTFGTAADASITLRVGGAVTIKGNPEALPVRLGLGEGERLADLIGPESSTDSTSATVQKARVKALLAMARIDITPAVLARLSSGVPVNLTGWKSPGDLVAVTDELKRRIEALAREAQLKEAEQRGHTQSLVHQLRPVDGTARSVDFLTPLERDASLHLARTQASAEARQRAEVERENLRAAMPPAPEWKGVAQRVMALDRMITDRPCSSAVIGEAIRDASAIREQLQTLATQAAAHEAALATLASAPTGATLEDVAEASAALDRIRLELQLARTLAHNDGIQTQLVQAEAAMHSAADHALKYRTAAGAIEGIRADLIRESGLAVLSLGPDGNVYDGDAPFSERSFGQRVRLAIECATGKMDAAGKLIVIPLSPTLWGALSPAAKETVGDVCYSAGVCLLTEEPTGGSTITPTVYGEIEVGW